MLIIRYGNQISIWFVMNRVHRFLFDLLWVRWMEKRHVFCSCLKWDDRAVLSALKSVQIETSAFNALEQSDPMKVVRRIHSKTFLSDLISIRHYNAHFSLNASSLSRIHQLWHHILKLNCPVNSTRCV